MRRTYGIVGAVILLSMAIWKVDLDAPSRFIGMLLPNTQFLGQSAGSSRCTKVLTISLSHQRLRPYDEFSVLIDRLGIQIWANRLHLVARPSHRTFFFTRHSIGLRAYSSAGGTEKLGRGRYILSIYTSPGVQRIRSAYTKTLTGVQKITLFLNIYTLYNIVIIKKYINLDLILLIIIRIKKID